MIQVPVEIFVWIGGGIFGMLTVCAHLLVNMNKRLTDISVEQKLQAAEMLFLKKLYMHDHKEGE